MPLLLAKWLFLPPPISLFWRGVVKTIWGQTQLLFYKGFHVSLEGCINTINLSSFFQTNTVGIENFAEKMYSNTRCQSVHLLYSDLFYGRRRAKELELLPVLTHPAPKEKLFKLYACSSLVFCDTFHTNFSTCCSLGL